MLLLFGLHSILSAAQVRYIEEVFSEEEITVIKNIPYNTNIGIFDKNGASLYGSPEGISYHPINLYVDIYLPTSIKGIDTASARPVAIIAHGGRFDRFLLDCYGGKDDLATTDLAKKLVKMGYVVVAPQMRMGYNTYYYYDVERMESTYPRNFYDAYIRQSIDLRNCARFLRKSIAEDGNPYKIHRDKFVLWSTNGGGSAVQYAAYYTSEKDFSGPNAPGFYPDYIPRTTYDSTYFGGLLGAL